MAEKREQTAPARVTTKTIEELQEEYQIKNHVFAGVKAANNWKDGKQVTNAEFLKACNSFLKAPMIGAGGK